MFRLILIFMIFMGGYLFKGVEKSVATYAKSSYHYMLNQIMDGFDEADTNPEEQPGLEVNVPGNDDVSKPPSNEDKTDIVEDNIENMYPENDT